MLRLLMIAGLFPILAACATLTETQCMNANWYEIGFQDGSNGRAATHFSRHLKACTKHGISPQRTPWEEGRQAGLRQFCVPERAYSIGKNGGGFPTVCTPEETIEMQPAFDWGFQYHLLTTEIEELEEMIAARLAELELLTDPNDPLFDLYAQYNWSDQRRIRRLEWQRQRYAYWPPTY